MRERLAPFSQSLSHWWTSLAAMTPAAEWPLLWGYAGLVLACFLGGILLLFLRTLDPALKDRFASFAWTNAWIGLLLFFFRFQRIPLFGMDLLRLIQEIAMAVWAILLLRYALGDYRRLARARQIEAYRTKHLPRPKRA